jgi:hypothetical protein
MANEQSRDTPWRQGLVLEQQAAIDLNLIAPNHAEHTVVVMVTHDCDIASNETREPDVEVIVGQRIPSLGADTNAKTARRLHIAFDTNQGPVAVELQATGKVTRPKSAVLSTLPRSDWKLTSEGKVTLQKWLAARYYRSAFADEFERRLKEKPAKLDAKIAKVLEGPSEHILAVLFDVDGGTDTQRNGADDVYQLHITLLYDSTKNEPAAFDAAQSAADAIEDAFEMAFCVAGTWRNIQLLSCLPVSDNAMSVAQSRLLKQWRLEHVSLETDPQQSMLN